MTYREYATMDRLMQGITPAPVEYIAEELGGEKFKTVCDDIYAVLKENELSVEQAEVMLEVVKARLKKMLPSLMPSTAAAIPCSPPPTMCTSGSAWHEKGGFER